MAEFVSPFRGMLPDRKPNDREPARASRLALAPRIMQAPIS
jgi:hypothetical protein